MRLFAIGLRLITPLLKLEKLNLMMTAKTPNIYTAVKPASLKRERVVEALEEAVGFLERSQVKNKRSKAYKGLYLYYDYDERIFRHPTWIWT